ncbi:MAG: hypothetical protein JWR38_3927 [Mucilaginibacter sp.]|nr:hypothetical protein [Mucilaginibacter sp.]
MREVLDVQISNVQMRIDMQISFLSEPRFLGLRDLQDFISKSEESDKSVKSRFRQKYLHI